MEDDNNEPAVAGSALGKVKVKSVVMLSGALIPAKFVPLAANSKNRNSLVLPAVVPNGESVKAEAVASAAVPDKLTFPPTVQLLLTLIELENVLLPPIVWSPVV